MSNDKKEQPAKAKEGILGQISDQAIDSMMEENRGFAPPKEFSRNAAVKSMAEYKALYDESLKSPDQFWGRMAEQLEWYKKWDKYEIADFKDKPEVRHFVGGKINVSVNCLDRHLKTDRKNKLALIWQGEPDEDVRTFTYQQLHHEVCKFANVLKTMGIK